MLKNVLSIRVSPDGEKERIYGRFCTRSSAAEVSARRCTYDCHGGALLEEVLDCYGGGA